MNINKIEKLLEKYRTIKFDTIFSIKEMRANYHAYAKQIADSKIPLGFEAIDKALCGGIRPNELITVIASTNVGKSTLALNVMRKAALKTPKLFIYFSLELAECDIYEMMIKMEHAVSTPEIEFAFANNQTTALDKIYNAEDKYKNIIAVVKRITVDEIIPYVKAIEELYNNQTALIAVDYTQLILNTHYKDTYNRATDTMQKLKEIALHLRLPVLCLSQVSRASAKAEDGLDIHSGKDSGAIEMSSQILLALERVKKINPAELDPEMLMLYEHKKIDLLKLSILKKKRGTYKDSLLIFDRKSLLMEEYCR